MDTTLIILAYVFLGIIGLGLLTLLMSFIVLLVLRVPFVRTPARAIETLLAAKLIGPQDIIYDLGAGDGKFLQRVVEATGCHGDGFEISPLFWFFGEVRAAFSRHWQMHLVNFMHVDLSPATIIFNFLAPAGIPGLTQKLNTEVRAGQTVISYGFQVPGWTPTQIVDPQPERTTGSKFYVYRKT
jgi:hypothetical protein